MEDYFKHKEGKDRGKVVLYALSTCLWCGKTKKLLNELNVDYYYADVDLLTGEAHDACRDEVVRWKKQAAYPCLVINDEKCIPFFDEEAIRKEFG